MLNPKDFKQPVVFLANGIGDHIIALPALRALSNIFCGRLSLIVVDEAYTEIFLDSDIVFKSVWFIKTLGATGTHIMQKMGRELAPFNYEVLAEEASGCDLFISLCLWTSPDLESLVKKISPPVSIGFYPTFTHKFYESVNCFDTVFSINHFFNPHIKIEDFSNPPSIEQKYLKLVHDLKNSMSTNKLLIVHTDTKQRKMWSADKFIKTIDNFLSVQNDYIVIIVGMYHNLPLESAYHKNRIFDICGIPLRLSFALLSVADLFLGIDSCLLHVADLFRVRGVGIFGPTKPQKWGFRFAHHKHITSDCIGSIASEEVIDALISLC
jgi:Glycosyltransferase family 9 (heptosyltransferase)